MHQSWHKPFGSRFSCQRNRQICRSATLCCAFIAIHRCGVWGLRVDKNPAPQRICLGCRIEKHPKNINKNLIHVSLLKSFSTVSEAICNSATGGPSPVAWRLQVWLLGHFGCDTSAQQPLLDRQVSCTGSDVAAVGVDGGGTGRFKTSKCYIFYVNWFGRVWRWLRLSLSFRESVMLPCWWPCDPTA